MMDWAGIITCIITTVLGGGVGVLATLSSTKRKAEADAQSSYDKVVNDRLDQMREEIDYERARNIALDEQHKREIDYERARNKELIVRNDDKERRYSDQTNRLREVQDRELKLTRQVIELTAKLGEAEVKYALYRCDNTTCPWCQPPKPTTLPKPEGMTIDEWHTQQKQINSDK